MGPYRVGRWGMGRAGNGAVGMWACGSVCVSPPLLFWCLGFVPSSASPASHLAPRPSPHPSLPCNGLCPQFLSSYYYGYIVTQVREGQGWGHGHMCGCREPFLLGGVGIVPATPLPHPPGALVTPRPLSPCFAFAYVNSVMYVCACVSASRWHAQFLGGVAAKRWGCRAVLSLGVLGSGVACMLTPLAASHSWAAAFAMRVTAGVSEGVVFPCTCKHPLFMHRIFVVVSGVVRRGAGPR